VSLHAFFRQLGRDLVTQKLRTCLTVFGITWGTVAVSLLLAFGLGLQRRQTRSMAGLGDRIVIAWPSRTSKPWQGVDRGRRILMRDEDIVFLERSVPGVAAISPEISSELKARWGTKVRAVRVSGVWPSYGAMRNMIPQEGGRFIDALDQARRRRVVFVGNEIAGDLFGTQDAVGKVVQLGGSPFTVIGVLQPKEQDSAYSGRDHSKFIIPESTFRALTGRRYLEDFIYKAERPKLNASLTLQIRNALARRMHFDPSDDQAIKVWDTTEMFQFFDAFMLAFNVFLGVMGLLTLVVGGIGVSNIMNVVVDERTREIGIKMALGAKGRTILLQFLAETLVITAAGGAAGLLLAFGICRGVSHLGLEQTIGNPVLSPGIAILTTVSLGLIGCIAGYFPARDAARLDPVVAMKV